eukprot:6342205-Prymnesium_polylepis.1
MAPLPPGPTPGPTPPLPRAPTPGPAPVPTTAIRGRTSEAASRCPPPAARDRRNCPCCSPRT